MIDVKYLIEMQYSTIVRYLGGAARKLALDLPPEQQTPSQAFAELKAQFGEILLAGDPLANFYERMRHQNEPPTIYAVELEATLERSSRGRNCKLAQLSSIIWIDDVPLHHNMTQTNERDDLQPTSADHHDQLNNGSPAARVKNLTVTDKMLSIIPSLDLSKSRLDSDAQKKQLSNLLHEYSDVFSSSSLDFGHTSTIKHSIPLIDNQSFRLPHRRIPHSKYQAVKDHLKEMEQAGAIRHSGSPYASPIVIVYKKDGFICICIDYCQLNKKTVRDADPLPRTEEALDALSNACLFTTIHVDLTSGYWQVEMEEDDKPKTAFTMNVTECHSDYQTPQPYSNGSWWHV